MGNIEIKKVHAVCSNKPRPSLQNNHSKSSQYWKRDVWHIRKSGMQTLCEAEQEPITVAELIKRLQTLPQNYTVYFNAAGYIVCGVTGAEDIGGDYCGQVFLKNFDCDPDIENSLKSRAPSIPYSEQVEKVAEVISEYVGTCSIESDEGGCFLDYDSIEFAKAVLTARGIYEEKA